MGALIFLIIFLVAIIVLCPLIYLVLAIWLKATGEISSIRDYMRRM